MNKKESWLKKDYFGNNIQLSFAIDKGTAQQAKPDIRFLFVGELKSPYGGGDHDYVTPKINNPVEKTFRNHYVAMQITQIWVYNFESGVVYVKVQSKRQ